MDGEFDFIIIGAGISGIDTAYRLQTQLPQCSYAIFEARDTIGGTWSFFKFPGIRSDSQLTVFGLPWKPWIHEKDIADGSLIQTYIESAARDEGIDKKIQFRHTLTAANWSTDQQKWTVDIDDASGGDGSPIVSRSYRASFLISCAGYYSYTKPLETVIPGLVENFKGIIAHPQFWPDDLDYSGKKVIIIGSGATAVTLLPVMAQKAGHITMLQRSPSYVASLSSVSIVGNWIKRFLPLWLAYHVNWWRCVLSEILTILVIVSFPNIARRVILAETKRQLPKDVSADVHFNPKYMPTDQRLCLCPDGDFFKALHRNNCSIITDIIDTVTTDGILTKSGQKIEADIIVTATGLHIQLFGGVVPSVDGKPADISKGFSWRGCMVTGVPNAGVVMGYTRNSWTLGADACVKTLIRVYKHAQSVGATSAVPRFDGTEQEAATSKPVLQHSSTYFVKAEGRLPRVTNKTPWYGRTDPINDYFKLWFGDVTRGMEYITPSKKTN